MKCLINCSGIPSLEWDQNSLLEWKSCKRAHAVLDCPDYIPEPEEESYEHFDDYIRTVVFPEALKICRTPAEVLDSAIIIPYKLYETNNKMFHMLNGIWKNICYLYRYEEHFVLKDLEDWRSFKPDLNLIMELAGLYNASENACRLCGYSNSIIQQVEKWKICYGCIIGVLNYESCPKCNTVFRRQK